MGILHVEQITIEEMARGTLTLRRINPDLPVWSSLLEAARVEQRKAAKAERNPNRKPRSQDMGGKRGYWRDPEPGDEPLMGTGKFRRVWVDCKAGAEWWRAGMIDHVEDSASQCVSDRDMTDSHIKVLE